MSDDGPPFAQPTLLFPEWYRGVDEVEVELKANLHGAIVLTPTGMRFSVTFMNPACIQYDLESDTKYNLHRPVIAEPGLLVVPEVTRSAMVLAVQIAWKEGFFDHLKPIS